ncbi:MAG: Arylsulfatase [candidate division BRC1 bacterium ADurb.BinA364]|nr:MAG: Arylsulfatase [candidate division BRC1 bacterium ADurb.BinA364]
MAASNGKRPNIVIFMMDTQGARNMSCYGYRRPTTPNIDQIAAEGVLFENHFVTGPWTLPVHSSLFTGRYESGHGAGAQHEGLEPGLPQMGEVFSKNGYKTIAFCGNGWAYDGGSQWSAGQGFEHIRYGSGEIKPVPPYIPSDNPNEKDKGSLKLVGVATKWIDDNYVANPDKPFLMFINCTEPHDAYLPPEPFRSRFLLDGVTYEEAVARKGGQAVSTMGDKCLTIDEWAMQRSLYDGSTACLDDRIGKFVGELKKRGVYDDTIFIVTGDHGDVQGEQVWYAYHSQNGVWDGTVKTPLVMRYPKKFAAGTRCKELVQINDIFPALMELAGIQDADASASIQGENLLRALEGATREFALIEAQRAIHVMRRSWTEAEDPETLDVRFANVWYKAARTLEWKYVWASNGQDMLFNIQRDPDERWNVIDRYPEIARDLMRKMETKLMSMEQRYFTDMFKPTNRKSHQPKVTRRLAAWGLYQPGIVPPYDPKAQEEWEKEFPG